MRIMTWNIQNGGAGPNFSRPDLGNVQNIVDVIEGENPDVAVIQEYQTDFERMMLGEGLERLSYRHTVWRGDADRGRRNRVLIASKLPFEDRERPNLSDYSKRNWNEIFIPGQELLVIGVDVPLAGTRTLGGRIRDNRRAKKQFLDTLLDRFREYQNSEVSALILGDFNLYAEAVYGEYLSRFEELFTEITSKEATWRDKKLDCIFANRALMGRISERALTPRAAAFSDHKYFFLAMIDRKEAAS